MVKNNLKTIDDNGSLVQKPLTTIGTLTKTITLCPKMTIVMV